MAHAMLQIHFEGVISAVSVREPGPRRGQLRICQWRTRSNVVRTSRHPSPGQCCGEIAWICCRASPARAYRGHRFIVIQAYDLVVAVRAHITEPERGVRRKFLL